MEIWDVDGMLAQSCGSMGVGVINCRIENYMAGAGFFAGKWFGIKW